jgi:hypothetical protein
MSVSQQINATSVSSLDIILQSVKTLSNVKFVLKITTPDNMIALSSTGKRNHLCSHSVEMQQLSGNA